MVYDVYLAVPEIGEAGMQTVERFEIVGINGGASLGPLPTGLKVRTQHRVMNAHALTHGQAGQPDDPARKERSVEDHGVSANGELDSRRPDGSANDLVARVGVGQIVHNEVREVVGLEVRARFERSRDVASGARLARSAGSRHDKDCRRCRGHISIVSCVEPERRRGPEDEARWRPPSAEVEGRCHAVPLVRQVAWSNKRSSIIAGMPAPSVQKLIVGSEQSWTVVDAGGLSIRAGGGVVTTLAADALLLPCRRYDAVVMNCLICDACSIVCPGMAVRTHANGWPR